MNMSETTRRQQEYYNSLLEANRGTPRATSSESIAHKRCRYQQISGVFEADCAFTLHDVGCGLGGYGEFLKNSFSDRKIDYSGTDIVPALLDEARAKHPGHHFYLRDLTQAPGNDRYDYVVLSGVFHQRRTTPIPEWERYLQALVQNAYRMCQKGLAFNVVSPFVDFYLPELYYANLGKIVNFVNDNMSRFFVIKHDYALFEMTFYVYRPEYVAAKYPAKELARYFLRDLSQIGRTEV